MIDRVFGIAAGLVFVAIGVAYVAGGQTVGRIVGAVLIVPFVVWVGVTVRRRRG